MALWAYGHARRDTWNRRAENGIMKTIAIDAMYKILFDLTTPS
jgi:hypothetical protein